MDNKIKKILIKQLHLLDEYSRNLVVKNLANTQNLTALTNAMINLGRILLNQNQFSDAAPNPYIGHLSMSDLEALAQARNEQARRQQEAEQRELKSLRSQVDELNK